MTSSAQQQQLLKILEDLLKLPENRDCADCGTKAPRWASTNLGVFICIRCSGIHRSMGVHISKVKSVSLDKWLPEQVEVMQRVGNGKANEIYEANVGGHHKGDIKNDNIALEQWIRDKYEHKRFTKRDYDSRPVQHSSNQSSYRDPPPRQPAYHEPPRHEPPRHEPPRQQPTYHEPQQAPALAPPRARAPSGGAPTLTRPRAPSGGSAASLGAANFTSQPKPTPAAPAAKSNPAMDLLNWDETPAPTSSTPPSGDVFGDFVGATPAQPTVDKDSIMSLFRPPMAPVHTMPPGYPPYGAQPHVYPGANYNIHGMGVPGAANVMMGMPGTGIPGGMPSGMPVPAPPAQHGMPPHMMGYPPQYGVPGYPPVGGVPGYYGIPGQQMGMHSNIPPTF